MAILVRTWAMRGTLHVLPAGEVGAYLAPLAAARTWEKASWQKTFLDAAGMRVLADAVRELLDGGAVVTREELTDAVVSRAGDPALAEHLRSGWGAVLKPLAWQGLLVQGPPQAGRVTFTSPASLPGWRGLSPLEEAGPAVVLAYLGAYGPAGPAAVDDWLLRGATPKKVLRGWFDELARQDLILPVQVDGEELWARAADADELRAAVPDASTRLLPAFDQYVLGPGTEGPARPRPPPPRRGQPGRRLDRSGRRARGPCRRHLGGGGRRRPGPPVPRGPADRRRRPGGGGGLPQPRPLRRGDTPLTPNRRSRKSWGSRNSADHASALIVTDRTPRFSLIVAGGGLAVVDDAAHLAHRALDRRPGRRRRPRRVTPIVALDQPAPARRRPASAASAAASGAPLDPDGQLVEPARRGSARTGSAATAPASAGSAPRSGSGTG